MELKHGTYLDASRKGKKIYALLSGVIQLNCVTLSIYKSVYMICLHGCIVILIMYNMYSM